MAENRKLFAVGGGNLAFALHLSKAPYARVRFAPATRVNAMALRGSVSSGTAFVANPNTALLGDKRFAAARIDLAQSCNGAGRISGPVAGGAFFYSKYAWAENEGDSPCTAWPHPHFAGGAGWRVHNTELRGCGLTSARNPVL